MMQFMVVGAPRSGTAWAANWFTTDRTLCLHDPLWRLDLESLDKLQTKKTLGMACTGVALFPEWVDQHPARKLILHRDIKEINASLRRMGIKPINPKWSQILERIEGLHASWRDLFEKPQPLWEFIFPHLPFDSERHTELLRYNVQMDFEAVDPDPAVVGRMLVKAGLAGEVKGQ